MLAPTGKVNKGRRAAFSLLNPAIFFLIPLVIFLLVSCQKTTIDSVNCRSVAYLIDSMSYKGKIVKTDTAIYWPQVCDSELNRFMVMAKTYQPVCGRPGCYWRLVIWK